MKHLFHFLSVGPEAMERQLYPELAILHAPTKPPLRSNNCFKKCLCWTLALITIQILFIAIIYVVFNSQTPKYSVDAIRITNFNLTNHNTTFILNITATNPNKMIGIYYQGGSHVSMWYHGTKLCQGSLPEFYQGRHNATSLSLVLAGRLPDAAGLVSSQKTGNIPLSLRARMPVRLRLRLGGFKLIKWKFYVRCRISVESFEQDSALRITHSSCKFRFGI